MRAELQPGSHRPAQGCERSYQPAHRVAQQEERRLRARVRGRAHGIDVVGQVVHLKQQGQRQKLRFACVN
jgi:hypothetical protein